MYSTYRQEAGPQEFKEGFTLRTVLGVLFVGMVMMPGGIYLGLVAGVQIGPAAEWVTIILFTELARRSFTVLRKQEIYVLYYVAAGLTQIYAAQVLSGGAFAVCIWNQYLIQSPHAVGFGIVDKIPHWVVPGPDSNAILERTFLHQDWIWPFALIVGTTVLFRFQWISLGYPLFRLTSDIERLPFPLAPVAAQGATALAEITSKSETWRWRIFSTGAMMGLLFGAVYVGVPAITGAFMSEPLTIIPIPFVDLTKQTEVLFPGAIAGLSLDLVFIFVGFIIPFPVIVGQFCAMVLGQFVAAPIMFKMGMLPLWSRGMDSIRTMMATSLDFWLSVQIGTSLCVAAIGLFYVVRALIRGVKKKKKTPLPKGRGDFNIPILLIIWLLSTLGFILLCHYLINHGRPRVEWFPISLFLFYGLVFTPLQSYITARMQGMTGQAVFIPYVREGTIILSGYKGIDIWFAPLPMFDHGWAAQKFREVELTGTKFTSIIKAEVFMLPVMLVCSFIFWGFFWKLSAIPSAVYPYVTKFWPVGAMFQCLWATATSEGHNYLLEAVKWDVIGSSFGVGFLSYGILYVVGAPLMAFYGFVMAFAAWPHFTIPMFVGGLLGRYYFMPKFGVEKWRRYAPVLLAGYSCGMGLIGMTAAAVALLFQSISYLPF